MKLGPILYVQHLLLYKYVCDTYICTFACISLDVCNTGCICIRHLSCLQPGFGMIRHYADDTFRLV